VNGAARNTAARATASVTRWEIRNLGIRDLSRFLVSVSLNLRCTKQGGLSILQTESGIFSGHEETDGAGERK
jgi:hypothetical protein